MSLRGGQKSLYMSSYNLVIIRKYFLFVLCPISSYSNGGHVESSKYTKVIEVKLDFSLDQDLKIDFIVIIAT